MYCSKCKIETNSPVAEDYTLVSCVTLSLEMYIPVKNEKDLCTSCIEYVPWFVPSHPIIKNVTVNA
jgi:hypothetical protein